jgi:hypothetical protein
MMPVVLKLLSRAARERRCAAIRYDGQRHLRIVEPHVIYLDDQGSVMADCYQVKGYSDSDKNPPFWRTFRVAKIEAAFLLNMPFEANPVSGLKSQQGTHGLLAAAYDRPPSVPIRARGAQADGILGHTRSLLVQFESALDEFLSGDESNHPN